MLAFADLLNDALEIRKLLEFVLRQPIPGNILTDPKSLLDIISKGRHTREKQIIFDTYASRQAYTEKIGNISLSEARTICLMVLPNLKSKQH